MANVEVDENSEMNSDGSGRWVKERRRYWC